MSKYAPYKVPTQLSADEATFTPIPSWSSTSDTGMWDALVLSDQCARGYHDYGSSDQCDCPCHRGEQPLW
jgi:hypothetical protein